MLNTIKDFLKDKKRWLLAAAGLLTALAAWADSELNDAELITQLLGLF